MNVLPKLLRCCGRDENINMYILYNNYLYNLVSWAVGDNRFGFKLKWENKPDDYN